MCESVWVGRSVSGSTAPVCVGGVRVWCVSLECTWCGECVGGGEQLVCVVKVVL